MDVGPTARRFRAAVKLAPAAAAIALFRLFYWAEADRKPLLEAVDLHAIRPGPAAARVRDLFSEDAQLALAMQHAEAGADTCLFCDDMVYELGGRGETEAMMALLRKLAHNEPPPPSRLFASRSQFIEAAEAAFYTWWRSGQAGEYFAQTRRWYAAATGRARLNCGMLYWRGLVWDLQDDAATSFLDTLRAEYDDPWVIECQALHALRLGNARRADAALRELSVRTPQQARACRALRHDLWRGNPEQLEILAGEVVASCWDLNELLDVAGELTMIDGFPELAKPVVDLAVRLLDQQNTPDYMEQARFLLRELGRPEAAEGMCPREELSQKTRRARLQAKLRQRPTDFNAKGALAWLNFVESDEPATATSRFIDDFPHAWSLRERLAEDTRVPWPYRKRFEPITGAYRVGDGVDWIAEPIWLWQQPEFEIYEAILRQAQLAQLEFVNGQLPEIELAERVQTVLRLYTDDAEAVLPLELHLRGLSDLAHRAAIKQAGSGVQIIRERAADHLGADARLTGISLAVHRQWAAEAPPPVARHHLTHILSRLPNDRKALRELAVVASKQARHQEAVALWQRLVRDSPDDPVLRDGLVNALCWANRRDDALAAARQAIAEPADWARLARAALWFDDYALAIEAGAKAHHAAPAVAKFALQLAKAQRLAGRKDAAIATLRTTVAQPQCDDDSALLKELAWLLDRRPVPKLTAPDKPGDFAVEGASLAAKFARSKDPEHAFRAALLYWRVGMDSLAETMRDRGIGARKRHAPRDLAHLAEPYPETVLAHLGDDAEDDALRADVLLRHGKPRASLRAALRAADTQRIRRACEQGDLWQALPAAMDDARKRRRYPERAAIQSAMGRHHDAANSWRLLVAEEPRNHDHRSRILQLLKAAADDAAIDALLSSRSLGNAWVLVDILKGRSELALRIAERELPNGRGETALLNVLVAAAAERALAQRVLDLLLPMTDRLAGIADFHAGLAGAYHTLGRLPDRNRELAHLTLLERITLGSNADSATLLASVVDDPEFVLRVAESEYRLHRDFTPLVRALHAAGHHQQAADLLLRIYPHWPREIDPVAGLHRASEHALALELLDRQHQWPYSARARRAFIAHEAGLPGTAIITNVPPGAHAVELDVPRPGHYHVICHLPPSQDRPELLLRVGERLADSANAEWDITRLRFPLAAGRHRVWVESPAILQPLALGLLPAE
jgi:Flp pilus assembly protein TadD